MHHDDSPRPRTVRMGTSYVDADAVVQDAVRRVAGRERLLVRHRTLYVGISLVAVIGPLFALTAALVDVPSTLSPLVALVVGLSGAAFGVLIGSRLEYRRRLDRSRLLRQLVEAEDRGAARGHDRGR